mmetsp:Transcript_6726/g.9768  ORF Transcript_6726/g.9768 Transcript_6726/m.9768 type:complete len:311 (+) Transcript_6726:1325-2257(+)
MPRIQSSAGGRQGRHQGLKFNKGHGQHILKNPLVIEHVLKQANIRPTDTILEIGPGTGNMTIQMLKLAKKVICIEIDPRMVVELKKRVQGTPLEHKLSIIHADVMKLELPFFNLCIANLPYSISSPIVFKLLAHRPMFRCAYLMFQREFAQRLVAKPNTPMYCRLSSNTQLLATVSHVMKVHKNSFRPPPKVDSSIVRIEPKNPQPQINFKEWDGFTRLCFTRKNKKLTSIFHSKKVLLLLADNLKTYHSLKQIAPPQEFVDDPTAYVRQRIDLALQSCEAEDTRTRKLDNHHLLQLLSAFNQHQIHFSN